MPNKVEYYLGQRIEHESERTVLNTIAAELASLRTDAIALVNFSVQSKQIDLVIATSTFVLLVEAKRSNRPVMGGENGPWRFVLPNGLSREFANPYQQTLSCVHALRDAMRRRFSGRDVPYPSAMLCYVEFAEGSAPFSGDHKVKVADLTGLRSALRASQRVTWGLDDWRKFALSLRLTKFDRSSDLTSEVMTQASDVLNQYQRGFADHYGPLALRWFEEPDQTVALHVDQMPHSQGTLLVGPSGCGKTLASYAVAMRYLDRGGIPVVIAAKDFAGRWHETLDSEIALLCETSARPFLGAIRQLEAPVLFVLDGFNELAPDHASRVMRGLNALVRRYQGDWLISSTKDDAVFEQLRRAPTAPPSVQLKRQIAQRGAGAPLSIAALELVDALVTGMECELAGSVIAELQPDSGRYALFDRYVRSRLGANASAGIGLVAEVASSLFLKPAFSMSEREWDRSFGHRQSGDLTLDALIRYGVLERQRDRVSFRHELYLQAFGAEAVVRASNSVEDLARALREPRHAERRAMIVSAIDDVAVGSALVDQIVDASLLVEAFHGVCGPIARDRVRARLHALLRQVSDEIADLSFSISDDDGPTRVVLNSGTIAPWTEDGRAGLAAIGLLVATGEMIDGVLNLCAQMDQRLEAERLRLRPRLAELHIGYRNAAFGYVFATPWLGHVGLYTIVSALQSFWQADRTIAKLDIAARLANPDVTNAQVYVLLKLTRGHFGEQKISGPLAGVIETLWATAPYHLRLDLLDAAHSVRDDEERDRLVALLLPMLDKDLGLGLNTSVVEALRSLGALDEDGEGARDSIREELTKVLREELENENAAARAWNIYVAQFDHPFDWVYAEEVAALDGSSRREFLLLAASGAPDDSFFLEFAAGEIALLEDRRAIPLFEKWAKPPSHESHVPQDAMRVFALAHRALGRFAVAPVESDGNMSDNRVSTIMLCGALLRTVSNPNLGPGDQQRIIEATWRAMEEAPIGIIVGVIAEVEEALTRWDDRPQKLFGNVSVASCSSSGALEVSRRFLDGASPAISYFSNWRDSKGVEFALDTIGRYGDSTDIPRLRRRASSASDGARALSVLRKLEAKL